MNKELIYEIKGGHKVADKRLDRVVKFDERSRKYSIGDLRKVGKKLRSYTWRCNQYFDQGHEGACVAYALGHELAARPSEVDGITPRFLIEDIYWEAQKTDPWPGGSYPGANPFYEGTSVLDGVKAVKKLGYIKEYRWAFTIEDVLYGIGHNGPAILGIPWFYNMYFPDENGFVKIAGEMVGGHAILARGINMKKGYVTLRNSWGPYWGKNGDCYVTIETLESLLKLQGECCFLLNRTVSPKPLN